MNPSPIEGKFAYILLNNQMPWPPRGTVPVNQGRRWEYFSIHDIRIAFGNGCDHSSYVVHDGIACGIRSQGCTRGTSLTVRVQRDRKCRSHDGHGVYEAVRDSS